MKKLVGYIIAIVGLIVMAISFGKLKIAEGLISSFGSSTLSIAGIVLIVVGVFISLMAEKNSHEKEAEELPIYEGTGKHRRVVGYRRVE